MPRPNERVKSSLAFCNFEYCFISIFFHFYYSWLCVFHSSFSNCVFLMVLGSYNMGNLMVLGSYNMDNLMVHTIMVTFLLFLWNFIFIINFHVLLFKNKDVFKVESKLVCKEFAKSSNICACMHIQLYVFTVCIVHQVVIKYNCSISLTERDNFIKKRQRSYTSNAPIGALVICTIAFNSFILSRYSPFWRRWNIWNWRQTFHKIGPQQFTLLLEVENCLRK